MISFLAGKPNPNTFPFQSLSVELKTDDASKEPETLKIDAGELVQGWVFASVAALPSSRDALDAACSTARQQVSRRSSSGLKSFRPRCTAARRTAGE